MLRAAPVALLAGLLAAGAASAALVGAGETVPTTSTTTAGTTTAATTTTAAPPAAAGSPSVTFLLAGHGYGHGAGLSQWGARGYAEHGWTYDRILARYYTGTALSQAPAGRVRVALVEGAKTLSLSSTGPWSVEDADGAARDLEPRKLALGTGLKIDGEALVPPLTFSADTPLTVGKKAYRGSIVVQKDAKGKLLAIDDVGLEDYLRGVVPAEIPSTWPAEALKAQAVAARTYAVANRAPAKTFDLYPDVRSQMYLGVAAERPATDAAVAATAGRIVTYGGQVISTLYSSSSGGRTADGIEAFGKAVPYLKSVDDPYDASPYRDWTATVDGARAGKALGLGGTVTDAALAYGPSGRVVTATLSVAPTRATATATAAPATVSGSRFRLSLGLRSTWFTLSLLSLTPPPSPVPYGSAATLAVATRGVAAPLLEQRAGGAWSPGPAITLAADGSARVAVRPARATDYRLGAGADRGTPVRVAVAAVVRLTAALRGSVRPAVAGRTVQVQRQQGAAWRTVATADVAPGGAFSAGSLGPGAYRARYAPGGGLVAGVSPPVIVP
jgi:stage II sporulation protein D